MVEEEKQLTIHLDIGYKPGRTGNIFIRCNIFSGEVGFCWD